MAVTNVKIVTGNGSTIEKGTIVMFQGRIVDVGESVTIPPDAMIVDASELIAYPGFIDGQSHLGIADAQRTAEERARMEDDPKDRREGPPAETDRAARRGIRSQVRALGQYAPESKSLESHRSAGFTAALIAPRDGIFSGTSSLVHLGDRSIRQSVIQAEAAMHGSFTVGEPGDYPQSLLGVIAQFRQVLLDARRHDKLLKHEARHPQTGERVPADAALEALQPVLSRSTRLFFEANSENEIRRALDLAKEFQLSIGICGAKEAWKVADRLKAENVPLIVSLKFDEEPEYGKKKQEPRGRRGGGRGGPDRGASEEKSEVGKEKGKEKEEEEEKIYESLKVRQERRRLWEEQVANVIRLSEAGIVFGLRTKDCRNPEEFFKNLRLVMERGWTEAAAASALGAGTAEALGWKGRMGAIAKGHIGNVTLLTKPLSDENAKAKYLFVDGRKIDLGVEDKEKKKEESKEKTEEGEEKKEEASAEKSEQPDSTEKTEASDKPEKTEKADKSPVFASEIKADRAPKTKTGGNVLIRNATVIPVSSATMEGASVLIRDGKIAALGKDIAAPDGVTVIDATGQFVMPGIVDCHSHLGLDGVNEGPLAISAEVRIADVVDPQSVGIYRALAGGATTHHAMHGSANPIGGQNVTLKLKYDRPVSEMLIPGAARTIKFALGENVKQSNFAEAIGKRFPNTRMGVESTFRAAFEAASAYQKEWEEFGRRVQAGEDPVPPRKDLRLEALADVLAGRMTVHCHSYRSEEILRLIEVAEEYGFRIGTWHHVLEGYRIAPELARHGGGASTFANMWAYKVEAYGAIPHNAALMTEHGITSSVNSDSSDRIRYMAQEAAKSIRWGGLNENEALRLVTLNPAMQLEIDARVGSLDMGKDGDIAIFNGHPLNSFSKCVMTLIEGEVFFEDGRPAATEPANRMGDPTEGRARGVALRREIPQTAHRLYAITNATIHPMDVPGEPGRVIENGTVVILEDKIHAVGVGVEIPPGAGLIDAGGLHVYPGLIDAGSRLGLDEIGAVRATQDRNEIGTFNPELRAIAAVHPHSEHVRITRSAGITTSLTRPGGGQISGQSSIIQSDGWTAAEMVMTEAFALHMSVPSLPIHLTGGGRGRRPPFDCGCLSAESMETLEDATLILTSGAIDDHAHVDHFLRGFTADGPEQDPTQRRKDEHKKQMRDLEELLARAKHYAAVKALAERDPGIKFETDLNLEAMVPYVRGEKPVVFDADGYKQILETIEFAEKHKLRCILSGGRETWKVAVELAKKDIPVILGSPTGYPSGEYEPWDSVYRCAGELSRAGVRFCFASDSASEAYNLGIEAGMAVAHGLPSEKAEYALTRGAAEILGIADRVGSIEAGKQADLIITTDSPLQAAGDVTHMFLAGRPIELSSMHAESYAKFKNRPAPKLPPEKTLRGPKSLTKR